MRVGWREVHQPFLDQHAVRARSAASRPWCGCAWRACRSVSTSPSSPMASWMRSPDPEGPVEHEREAGEHVGERVLRGQADGQRADAQRHHQRGHVHAEVLQEDGDGHQRDEERAQLAEQRARTRRPGRGSAAARGCARYQLEQDARRRASAARASSSTAAVKSTSSTSAGASASAPAAGARPRRRPPGTARRSTRALAARAPGGRRGWWRCAAAARAEHAPEAGARPAGPRRTSPSEDGRARDQRLERAAGSGAAKLMRPRTEHAGEDRRPRARGSAPAGRPRRSPPPSGPRARPGRPRRAARKSPSVLQASMAWPCTTRYASSRASRARSAPAGAGRRTRAPAPDSRLRRMRSAFTVMPCTMSVKRRSMWSRARKLSGTITRSTDEWLMSRSCQSATFSRAASAFARTRRARPVTCSQPTGLRLCGMAEQPFWPLAERLLHLAHLRLLQRADLGRELLEAGGHDRERRHHLGVAVALQDLRGDGRGREARAARRPPPRPRAAGARRCRPRPRACPPRSSRAREPGAPGRATARRTRAPASARTSWARRARRACGRSSGVCLILEGARLHRGHQRVHVRADEVAGVAHQHARARCPRRPRR